MHYIRSTVGGICGIIFLLSACNLSGGLGTSQTSLPPSPTPSVETNAWQEIATGLERRTYAPDDNAGSAIEVVRIDPTRYQFRIHYEPGNPLGLGEWQQALEADEVVAFVNANFFDPQNQALGLLIADGEIFNGSVYRQGGIFIVQNGAPAVRSNAIQPYQGENAEQAVETFPMLVVNGEPAGLSQSLDRRTRRTIIAQDTQQRILLMATPFFGMSLFDLSQYLPTTDMDIVNALNLDGGGSTMMYIQPSDERIFSFDPVPVILAVYEK